ncbi:CvpA family protein [Thermogemmatispora sp.]|uniref:CvpA family protein n=1 Tax=Thermogemmatispora sp. TaxID=1968838 RepID=UPI0035E43C4F
MPLSFNWIDIAFLATAIVLVINGFHNGLIASLINLISLPLALGVALIFGPSLTMLLASNGAVAAPLPAYALLFFATVLCVHIVTTLVRAFVHRIPMLGFMDELLGVVLGFVEAWLLWLILLLALHGVLSTAQNIPGGDLSQFSAWQQAYNEAIAQSLFVRINQWLLALLPLKRLP